MKNTILKSFCIKHQEKTDILFGNNSLEKLPLSLKNQNYSSFVLICDQTVKKILGKKVKNLLSKLNIPILIKVIPHGEKSKSINTVNETLEFLLKNGIDRKACLIALGGGVVGDIATVISGLYFRGIDLIQIPTTLLSQVDSSLGGKGGINIGHHKNSIGVIKQPKIIIIDPLLLKTLPPEQFKSGMAEVIKYAIALDCELFEMLEITNKISNKFLNWIIERCLLLKMKLVQKDPLDILGIRSILNFGHTIGQTIELQAKILHGEAISIGMAAAVFISHEEGMLSKDDLNRSVNLLIKFRLPTQISNINLLLLNESLKQDKKTINGKLNFVLIRGIGKTKTKHVVSENSFKNALKEIII